jgi:hypothetical protein
LRPALLALRFVSGCAADSGTDFAIRGAPAAAFTLAARFHGAPFSAPVSLSMLIFITYSISMASKRIGAKLSPETMPEHLKRIGGTLRFRLGVPAALKPIVG